ncbi:ABC transporter permease [Corynebacterium aquilae]|uniref:ABC transporter permease n=1 Tax=Corynebacterium aquilae DSM 44791 TaxID=1431546 RepID=A0A1L7CIL9_9CORY|nr:FtsX-like permease family protein [Corynebacterium aquilae]APT85701.1 hypothetical protein CAQU_12380 [Corynebacterium aquilae DSM 44791]
MAKNAMRTISVRTIVAHKVRLLLTILSVVLGTAFIAGSAMFTNSLSNSFEGIVATQFDKVDVAVMGQVPITEVQRLRQDADVDSVEVSAQGANVIVAGPDKKVISSGGAPSMALAMAPGQQELSTQGKVVSGHLPTADGEVAINSEAAKKGGLQVGDELTIVTPTERITRTLSGTFQAATSTGGWIGVAFPEDDYLKLFTDGSNVSTAQVSLIDHGEEHVNEVRDRLRQQYPGMNIESGKVLAEEFSKTIKQLLSFINYFLWAFAGIALLVGTFIISNTFSMIVAQRNREFALLRAIGTSSKQITRSVVFESVVVGVIGSAIGIVAGMGLVKLLTGAMKLGGIGLPDEGLALNTTSVVAPLLIGTAVTVWSAWAPAKRAGAIRPVQAMRQSQSSGWEGLAGRTIAGTVMLFAGAMACVLAGSMDGGVKPRAIGVGVGAVLLVLGLWLAGPALSIPVVGFLGRVAGAPFRAVGRLAATNSDRNPRRTAATAFALTLGLMMVSSIGMLGATMRASLSEMLDSSMRSDYVLTGRQEMGISIPAGVAQRVEELPDVTETASLGLAPITVNGSTMVESFGPKMSTVYEGNISQLVDIDFTSGGLPSTTDDAGSTADSGQADAAEGEQDAQPGAADSPIPAADAADGGAPAVVMSSGLANRLGVKVGEEVTLANGNRTAKAPVTGIYQDNPVLGWGMLNRAAATMVANPGEITTATILVNGGRNKQALREELENAVAEDLVVSVKNKEEAKGEQTASINQMLGILYGLLGLAVVVAILGIINTLALSVVERRQEIGMLRAVGMQRRQIRTMIYIESAVIAVFGALTGAAVGLGVGYAFVSTLAQSGLNQIVIPWSQVAGMLVASAFIGVLAAVFPAGRAARTRPLEAITE